jgi:hypothetical protein
MQPCDGSHTHVLITPAWPAPPAPLPLAGESFFQEGLARWRELNTAAHFTSFAAEAFPLCATLPLLIVHQDALVAKLLCRLTPEAALSLDALTSLAGLLARDLRADFLRHAPALFAALAALLAAGAERHPEQMARPDSACTPASGPRVRYALRCV